MTDYQDYRFRLRMLSALGTPMHSDTLFGHLAWQVRHAEGDQGIREFLKPFGGEAPPFVLSDAFPAGLLPRPLVPAEREAAQSREEYAAARRWRKAAYVTVDDFLAIVRGGKPAGQPVANPWRAVQTPHAPVNRGTEAVGTDPGLFHTQELVTVQGDSLDVYARVAPDWVERLRELVAALCKLGFGRDRSTGVGAIAIKSFGPWEGFAPVAGAEAFVSLSSMVPAASDPTEGRWRVRVKHGMLGEQAGKGVPFKRPLVQLLPGAVFRTASPIRPFYGRIVRGIAPAMPEAVQCGLALAVPCRWRPL